MIGHKAEGQTVQAEYSMDDVSAKLKADMAAGAAKKALINGDAEAVKLIAEGAKVWERSGMIRVYLTDGQKLARAGYKADGKGAIDADGLRLSNAKTAKITAENSYYDVVKKAYF